MQAVLDKFQIRKEDLREHVIKGLENPYLDKIVKITTNYEIESEILLIGFDAEGRAMTTYIYDGKAVEHRDLNFHAIGSGKHKQ